MAETAIVLEKKDPYSALKFTEFRSFLGMRMCITFGVQMQAVVMGWHIYQLTHDPLSLGLIGLTEAVPALSIALFAGHIADNQDRKKMLFFIILGQVVSTFILLLITQPKIALNYSVSIQISVLYIMIFFNGIFRGFYSPTASSMVALMLPRNIYANSTTWNSTGFQLAAILGPAAGGLIFGFFGITSAFSVILVADILAFIFSRSLVSRKVEQIKKHETILDSLKEGIRFVFKTKMMLSALSLDLFSVFFGGAVALLPVFSQDILHVGPKGLGYLRAAPSIGALLAMLFMAYRSPTEKAWRNLLIAVLGFGLATLLFGFSKNFYLSLFALFLTGIFDSISVIVRSTIMQLLTPDELRGRVSAVNTMFIGSSNEIGAFESGFTARIMGGAVNSVLFGGSMVILIVGYTYSKSKALFKVNLQLQK
jgi:MFS family permease